MYDLQVPRIISGSYFLLQPVCEKPPVAGISGRANSIRPVIAC
jgi:hypothetical protein